jgi:hypothetical protein
MPDSSEAPGGPTKTEPVVSGGVAKVVGLVLVAAVLGGGAYLLAGGGLDIDLPDLPETPEGATTIEEGEFTDTNLGTTPEEQPTPEPAPAPTDAFTTAGFADALAQVRAAAGPGAQATSLSLNDVQSQFIVREGDGVRALSVRADSGEVVEEEATVTISGNATIEDFYFGLDGLKPAAVDRMVAAAKKLSGAADFRPTVLNLERQIPTGSRELEWTINAEGGGRNLLYRARADGSGVRNESGAGTPIPPAAQDARRLNDCIQAAANDPDKIFACLDKF